MMRDLRVIIASVVFIVTGVGVMSMWEETRSINTLGGALFFIGLILLSLALFHILNAKNNNHSEKTKK